MPLTGPLKNNLRAVLTKLLGSHWRIRNAAVRLSRYLPESLDTQIWFFFETGRFLNLNRPTTLTDKINWLKINRKDQRLLRFVERTQVREYISKAAPTCRLPDVLLRTKSLTVDQWDELPAAFVIKASHGAGMTKIVQNKNEESYVKVHRTTSEWLKTSYADKYRERIYERLERYLIVEELLRDPYGDLPNDYKFFCLNGRVAFVDIHGGRFANHTRTVVDRAFTVLDVTYGLPINPLTPTKPARFDKAVEVAEGIAKGLEFVRVDLYIIGDQVYFGEMTFIPAGGRLDIMPVSFDAEMGKRLTIDTAK